MNTIKKWNYNSNAFISFFMFFLLVLGSEQLFAQGVGISESSITPDASSILELRSASRGFIVPRLATGSIVSPVRGLLIYNGTTDGNFLSFYNGSWITLAPLTSPSFTGTVVFPTPFTLGATSVTSTGTQMNYLNAAAGTTGTVSSNLVFSASPTFSGTVTMPTPFTLGATSVTLTGTQLNFLNAAVGTTGTASSNLVFSASPTFTGTVTIPSPLTLGAVSMTSTGTQLNYLNAATGTTGTTSSNLVFSASPTFTGTPTLPTGTIATTQTFGDNTTALATTAFVQSETPTYSRVAGANATTGVGALTNITGLTFATAANTVYEFEACLTVQSSTVAGNQYGVQHSTAGASVEALITGTLAAATQKTLRINALNTAATPFVTVAATGGILIKGIFTTGVNAGNLTIQHNKITGGTSTVFINSYLKVTKVQ